MYMDSRKNQILLRCCICMILCMALVFVFKNINYTYKNANDYHFLYQKSFGMRLDEAGIEFSSFYKGMDYELIYDKNTKNIHVRTNNNEIKFVAETEKDVIYTGYSRWSFRDKYSYFSLLNDL